MATKKSAQSSTKGLEDLFYEALKDIYYAERKILSALKKMARGAESQELTAAFEKHRDETEGQVERLQQGSKFSASARRARPVRPSTAFLRKARRFWRSSRRRRPSTPDLSPRPRPLSIMKLPAMARL